METTTQTWDSAPYLAACAAMPRERIPSDGFTTCLWHRQHEYIERVVAPLMRRCDLCGGEVDYRAERHELCRLRAASGRPTPTLRQVHLCPCHKCHKAVLP